MPRTSAPAALVLLALAISGCTHSGSGGAVALRGPSSGDKSLVVPYGAKLPSSRGDVGAAEDSAGVAAGVAAPAPAAALRSTATEQQADPALRAGSVDDNAHFDDYLDYRARTGKRIGADELDISERHVVTVVDRDGKPVLGAAVTLGDGQQTLQTVRTHADGRALLFPLVTSAPRASSYDVQVSYAGATASARIDDRAVREHTIKLDIARPAEPVRLDLHFLVDTTGSMGDEIDRLRTTLDDVAKQIDALPQQPQVRYGLTIYKDHGDEYVSRTGDFTDLATFRAELARVTAGGGGDTPEALDESFHGAVNGPAWDSERAVQIIFLVADASPHLGDQAKPSYADDVQVAAAKGIEVVPLAASGTDDPAEYVFRQLAEYSLGTFFFLTYGPDGHSPGDGTDRDVHGYATGSLDELIVKHVADRLGALDGKAPNQ